jgi:hypothetical protein
MVVGSKLEQCNKISTSGAANLAIVGGVTITISQMKMS